MNPKQDRQGVRTPTDLDRRYDLGGMKKSVSAVINIPNETREIIGETATDLRREFNAKIVELEQETDKKIAAELEGYVENDELGNYAKTSDLASYAKKTDLGNYATTTALNGVAESVSNNAEAIFNHQGAIEHITFLANEAFSTAQGVANDVNDHFEFADGGTRIKGVFNAMLLPAGTDLDGVILPNRYIGGSIAVYGYLNCPVTTGTFFLNVEPCGDQGQILQRLTYSHKTDGKTFERVSDTDGWGAWICVADYTGAALNAMQAEVNTLEIALGEHISSFAASVAETGDDLGALNDSVNALSVRTQQVERNVQSVTADLQAVTTDINDHFDFNEGGMTIKGAINPMLIPAGADLDGLTIPNKYIGGVVTEYKYLNCPVTSGTFSLDVDSCGTEGQLRQRITYCHKTNSKTWERFSYGVDWGAWVLSADHAAETVAELRADVEADLNTLDANLNSLGAELDAVANRIDNLSVQSFLWSGQNYMTATQTVNLSGKVSEQKNGIVLVFCEYINGAAATSAFHSFFIPKEQVVTHPGKGYTFTLATGKFEYMATKYLYIDNEKIDGHADNNTTGTGTSGIKYTNNRFVLRYVIGI